MLTTTEDEVGMIKESNNANIKEFIQKPLSEKEIRKLIRKYFPKTKLAK